MHGPVILDVWLRSDDEGALTAEHCGHVEISLNEIFQDGKPEIRTHNSIRTGEVTEYRTQVLKARKRVTCLWTSVAGSGGSVIGNVPATALAPSYLYVDLWLRPFDFMAFNTSGTRARSEPVSGASSRLSRRASGVSTEESHHADVAGRDPLLPHRVRGEWVNRSQVWEDRVAGLNEKYFGNRGFEFSAKSQNRDAHFLPLFLDVIRPPELLGNPKAIAFWIHCLSHTSMADLKTAVRFWSTPDFTLSLGKGDTFAHAILHASILRGLSVGGVRPFVCVGTGWDGEPIAWVLTMKANGTVTFWDTITHTSFELPNRCADLDRCRRVVESKRAPGQHISSELMEIEARRRQRLTRQELVLKGRNMQASAFSCDEQIFRAPEILKLYDSTIHEHALVFVTNVSAVSQCYRCGLPAERRIPFGFVCHKKLLTKSNYNDTDNSCMTDQNGSFLCLRCADKSYGDEGALPRDLEGNFSSELFPPCKFLSQPILPYKSIDLVFDATNCWMNLQHFSPSFVLFDFWNPTYWHPFTTISTTFRSFSMASKGLRKAKSKEYFNTIRARIIAKVKKSIQSLRRNGNLATYFQTDPLLIEHMEFGLELQFRLELAADQTEAGFASAEKLGLDSELCEWKLQLYSKVPRKHRFVGHTFQFSFYDSIEIARIVTEQVKFLDFKDAGTQIVLASYIGKLPNSVTACYLSVGLVFPIPDSAIRQVSRSDDRNPFEDEQVEHHRLFTQRSNVFGTDDEFISTMRAELYRDKDRAVAGSSKTATSRAPVGAGDMVKSVVDYAVDGEADVVGAEGIENGAEEEDFEGDDPGHAEIESGGGFGAFLQQWVSGGEPADGSTAPRQTRTVKPPKDFSNKHTVVSPLPLMNPLNPSPEELRQIYRPATVDRVVGQRQFLRHASGVVIPIPPQAPLQQALALGGSDLTTKVHVRSASSKRTVTTVPAPKEEIIKFNSAWKGGQK